MKKRILIILFLYICFPLKAQDSIHLIDVLLNFCQEATKEEPSEEKILYIFQSIPSEKINFLPIEKKNNLAGFAKEKIVYANLKGDEYDGEASLIFYKKGDKKVYTLDLSIHSRYDVIKGKVCYDKTKYLISFPELTEKLGNIFYDSVFQAKDTKMSDYIYQNPQTHKKMVFSIKSYNPPEAMYNIIYRIEIKDISFFDEVYLKKDEFFLKN